MIEGAQIILDITAIGVSIYTLIKLIEVNKEIASFHARLLNTDSKWKELKDDLEQIVKFQQELSETSGLEPGVYLPKGEKKQDGEQEYQKAMDMKDWANLLQSP